jgi:DNA replicative helicase MCM subunit Mcm2 (Cdc46/Mcm family)
MVKKNPFGRGRAFTFHGSFTSKILARRREKEIPSSFIYEKNKRFYVLKPKRIKSNPVKKVVRIYGRVLRVEAQKLGKHVHCDAECKKCNHKYVHDFRSKTAKMIGLSPGDTFTVPPGKWPLLIID